MIWDFAYVFFGAFEVSGIISAICSENVWNIILVLTVEINSCKLLVTVVMKDFLVTGSINKVIFIESFALAGLITKESIGSVSLINPDTFFLIALVAPSGIIIPTKNFPYATAFFADSVVAGLPSIESRKSHIVVFFNPSKIEIPRVSLSLSTNTIGTPFSFKVLNAESWIKVITKIRTIGMINKIDKPTLSLIKIRVSFFIVAQSLCFINLLVCV